MPSVAGVLRQYLSAVNFFLVQVCLITGMFHVEQEYLTVAGGYCIGCVMKHGDGRPYGMPRKAYGLIVSRERFEEWVVEGGGEDGCLELVCAQVANGVTLKALRMRVLAQPMF